MGRVAARRAGRCGGAAERWTPSGAALHRDGALAAARERQEERREEKVMTPVLSAAVDSSRLRLRHGARVAGFVASSGESSDPRIAQ